MSTKFENWSVDQKRDFALRFSEEYNRVNGTTFKLGSDSFNEKDDYDLVLFDRSQNELKIQHTVAGALPKEFILPKNSELIVTGVRKYFNRFPPKRGLSVSLNLKQPPVIKQEQDNLIRDIVLLVEYTVENSLTPCLFKFNSEYHNYYSKIERFITEFEIVPRNDPGVVFGFSWNDGSIFSAVLPDDIRFDMAFSKKADKYANPLDLVLVVDFSFPAFGLSDFYLSVIRKKYFGNVTFKQVWAYDSWQRKFIKIL